jgi:hypothetical protein
MIEKGSERERESEEAEPVSCSTLGCPSPAPPCISPRPCLYLAATRDSTVHALVVSFDTGFLGLAHGKYQDAAAETSRCLSGSALEALAEVVQRDGVKEAVVEPRRAVSSAASGAGDGTGTGAATGSEGEAWRPWGFSTSPAATPTHWKQAVLFLASPLSVTAGNAVKGSICMKRDAENHREYRIVVELEVPSRVHQQFHMR